jgi:hypothetical protein
MKEELDGPSEPQRSRRISEMRIGDPSLTRISSKRYSISNLSANRRSVSTLPISILNLDQGQNGVLFIQTYPLALVSHLTSSSTSSAVSPLKGISDNQCRSRRASQPLRQKIGILPRVFFPHLRRRRRPIPPASRSFSGKERRSSRLRRRFVEAFNLKVCDHFLIRGFGIVHNTS